MTMHQLIGDLLRFPYCQVDFHQALLPYVIVLFVSCLCLERFMIGLFTLSFVLKFIYFLCMTALHNNYELSFFKSVHLNWLTFCTTFWAPAECCCKFRCRNLWLAGFKKYQRGKLERTLPRRFFKPATRSLSCSGLFLLFNFFAMSLQEILFPFKTLCWCTSWMSMRSSLSLKSDIYREDFYLHYSKFWTWIAKISTWLVPK